MPNNPKFDQALFVGQLAQFLLSLAIMAVEKQGLDTQEKRLAWFKEQDDNYVKARIDLEDSLDVLQHFLDQMKT